MHSICVHSLLLSTTCENSDKVCDVLKNGNRPPHQPATPPFAPPASAPQTTTSLPHLQTVTSPRRRSGVQSSSAGTTTWWPLQLRPPARNGSSRGQTPCSPQGPPHQGQWGTPSPRTGSSGASSSRGTSPQPAPWPKSPQGKRATTWDWPCSA